MRFEIYVGPYKEPDHKLLESVLTSVAMWQTATGTILGRVWAQEVAMSYSELHLGITRCLIGCGFVISGSAEAINSQHGGVGDYLEHLAAFVGKGFGFEVASVAFAGKITDVNVEIALLCPPRVPPGGRGPIG